MPEVRPANARLALELVAVWVCGVCPIALMLTLTKSMSVEKPGNIVLAILEAAAFGTETLTTTEPVFDPEEVPTGLEQPARTDADKAATPIKAFARDRLISRLASIPAILLCHRDIQVA